MTTKRIVSVVAVSLALAVGGAFAQNVTWTGNGDPNNSGIWSAAANWGGSVPTTSNATLPSVTINRTITVDTASTVNAVRIEQSDATTFNKLSLSANLTLSRVSAGATVYDVVLSGGATAANVVTDLNGQWLIITTPPNNADNLNTAFGGTFNFNQAGSSVYSPYASFGPYFTGVVNVTANGSVRRASGSSGLGVGFTTGSSLNIGSAILSIDATGIINDRQISIRNSGTINLTSTGTLSQRLTGNATTSGGKLLFTNNSTGSITHAGLYEYAVGLGNATYTPGITMTNNGIWTISGTSAVIKRLEMSNSTKTNIALPNLVNQGSNATARGIIRGSSSSDTLEFNEQVADGTRRMTITNNGTIQAGAGSGNSTTGLTSVGSLILRDIDVTSGSAGRVEFDIGGKAAGQFDNLLLSSGTTDGTGNGTFTANGTLQLWTVNGFSDPGTAPFQLKLIEAGTVSGTFAALKFDGTDFTATNQYSPTGNSTYYYEVLYNTGTGGSNSVVLNYIPEPGTASLLLGGLAAVLIRRRRAKMAA